MVVVFALSPEPPALSAALPLKLAGTVAGRKALPAAGVVTEAADGTVLSSVKVTAVPVKLLPVLSVAFAWIVYVASACDAHVGRTALLVHVAAVPLLVA